MTYGMFWVLAKIALLLGASLGHHEGSVTLAGGGIFCSHARGTLSSEASKLGFYSCARACPVRPLFAKCNLSLHLNVSAYGSVGFDQQPLSPVRLRRWA